MARILVTGDMDGIAARTLLERLVEHIRKDGHDAALAGALQDPAQEVRDADAIVALMDVRPHPDTVALVAYGEANRKPILGCFAVGAVVPKFLKSLCTQVAEVRRGSDIHPALQTFYERVKPFAGRLVRDNVPELVRQAGHTVKFRQLDEAERPRFLKRKIAEEAHALDTAAVGREKEELADLLEALEAFIDARGFDREELKSVKNQKKQARGGFQEGFVVEAAVTSEANEPPAPAAARATTTRAAPASSPTVPSNPTTTARDEPAREITTSLPERRRGKQYEGPTWEADDVVPVADASRAQATEPKAKDKDSSAQVWEL